jgi:hypothetical protein
LVGYEGLRTTSLRRGRPRAPFAEASVTTLDGDRIFLESTFSSE